MEEEFKKFKEFINSKEISSLEKLVYASLMLEIISFCDDMLDAIENNNQ